MTTGSKEELLILLNEQEVLYCTRDWSAWHYKTMSDEDFVAVAGDADCVESYIKWRDDAVNHAQTESANKLLSIVRQVEIEGQYGNAETEAKRLGFLHGLRYAASILKGEEF